MNFPKKVQHNLMHEVDYYKLFFSTDSLSYICLPQSSLKIPFQYFYLALRSISTSDVRMCYSMPDWTSSNVQHYLLTSPVSDPVDSNKFTEFLQLLLTVWSKKGLAALFWTLTVFRNLAFSDYIFFAYIK